MITMDQSKAALLAEEVNNILSKYELLGMAGMILFPDGRSATFSVGQPGEVTQLCNAVEKVINGYLDTLGAGGVEHEFKGIVKNPGEMPH